MLVDPETAANIGVFDWPLRRSPVGRARDELGLGRLAVVPPDVVAGLEVHTDDGVGVETEVDGENLQTDVVVVHLVVAKGDIDVDGVVVFVLNQQFLVNLSSFFEV